jgi:hypothetical protein
MGMLRQKSRTRGRNGQISDTAVSLLILLFFGFFPLVNLAYAACVYFVGCYYNDIEIRELAVHRQKDFSTVRKSALDLFAASTVSQFVFRGPPQIDSAISVDSTTGTITDTCTIKASPFLPMPMFSNVPGLGATMTFTVSQTRPQDEVR